MAVNYASKYSSKVDERFYNKSFTEKATNQDYDFVGVDTVNIYSIPTSAMNDYVASGTNRYGTPAELSTSVQTLTLAKDRSFTFTIDKKTDLNTPLTKAAGQSLARQLNEVVIPEVDSYRLSTISAAGIAAGGTNTLAAGATDAITASNAYDRFLSATEYLDENKVPVGGRIAFVTPAYYNFLKQDNSFILQTESAQKALYNGQIGMVDDVAIIKAPSSYFPANTDFIITHRIACVAPKKLEDYKIHQDPPGINGWLIEGRIIYDAFVLDNKNTAIYVHKNLG